MKKQTFALDTIAAISTPPGEGAIAIVRLSGVKAMEIADRAFKGSKALTKVLSHTIHYGHIKDPSTKAIVDEVMVSVMRAPKTFTCEDVVEINCHGGIVVANQVLQLLLRGGAKLAEPGEFTKRAFLNGRIDLSQAEAVMDLIRAKTNQAMDMALGQLEGNLSSLIRKIRQKILEILAQVEVSIDYPGYDEAEEFTNQALLEKVQQIQKQLDDLLKTATQGKILREGLKTAIIGRPNVGKSSLLNTLLQEEKAIVTEIAGTTRDVIEEMINIRGIPLKLIDTAGIRETKDLVEQMGVKRSHKALQEADFILLVLNANEALTKEDLELIKITQKEKRIILLNKMDLTSKIKLSEVAKLVGKDAIIQVSVLKNEGLDALEEKISELFFGGAISINKDTTYLSNSRHISLIEQAKSALLEAIAGLKSQMPIDLVQIDLTRCWENLGEIIGEIVQDELITQLFSQFCLGK
ncbi:MAG: tRNA uridine-5-carboxymethylaminomethyl(34) synthesis GTPase MnmE [Streptococcaceae bacterium]|jgi:tRNA modification GTPase|nr:tRNA uridine-5-carboxymethylaminomethyl(34) synthesis GTPase MnmE [Streptococcaceae bacterium]